MQHVPSARPSELTVGQHYPSLTTRAVPLSRARCYFVEEIIHRVRVIGILFVFDVSIGPTSFTMAAGKNEALSLRAIHNVQLLAPNALSSSCLVFRLGRVPPGSLAAFVLASKFHSDGADFTAAYHRSSSPGNLKSWLIPPGSSPLSSYFRPPFQLFTRRLKFLCMGEIPH